MVGRSPVGVANFDGGDFVFLTSSAVTYTYPIAGQPNLAIPFIGGGIVPVTLHVQVAGTAQNATVTGTWSGEARLTYTYEPAPTPVPEPALLLLFGSGVSAVAWRLRQVGATARGRSARRPSIA